MDAEARAAWLCLTGASKIKYCFSWDYQSRLSRSRASFALAWKRRFFLTGKLSRRELFGLPTVPYEAFEDKFSEGIIYYILRSRTKIEILLAAVDFAESCAPPEHVNVHESVIPWVRIAPQVPRGSVFLDSISRKHPDIILRAYLKMSMNCV